MCTLPPPSSDETPIESSKLLFCPVVTEEDATIFFEEFAALELVEGWELLNSLKCFDLGEAAFFSDRRGIFCLIEPPIE